MANIDATTPQLQVVKKWLDAYVARDANKIAPVLSKNYKHQTFSQSVGIPDETKEQHIKRYGGLAPSIASFEVRIQHQSTDFDPGY